MNGSFRAVAALLAGLAAVGAGCGDFGPPRSGSVPAGSLDRGGAALLGLRLVAPVERVVPLEHEVTWTFVAGPAGAVSRNAAVGLTIVVPFGALTTTQTISVTALAGAPVAYRFTPHLEFARPVRLKQDLSHIRVGLLTLLVGGHFSGDFLQITNGLAAVTETVPAIISILGGTVNLDVGHFSGWIVASGNDLTPSDTAAGSSQ